MDKQYSFIDSRDESCWVQEKYDAFVRRHYLSAMLQSRAWAQVKDNWKAMGTALCDEEGALLVGGQLLLRSLPFGFKLAYMAHGPMMDYSDKKAVNELLPLYLEGLKALAHQQGCFELRLHLPCELRRGKMAELEAGYGYQPPEGEAETAVRELMQSEKFVHQGYKTELGATIQARFQAIVELGENLEKPSGRLKYNLTQCRKRSVDVLTTCGEKLDEEIFAAFIYTLNCTEKRQGITLRSPGYFRKIMKEFAQDAKIYVAKLNLEKALQDSRARLAELETELEALLSVDKIKPSPKKRQNLQEQLEAERSRLEVFVSLEGTNGGRMADGSLIMAGCLTLHCGEICELPYAGSDPRYYKIPAVWRLYHQAMLEAKAAGAKYFNMGGVEGNLQDGLSQFKRHFDPWLVETAGEYCHVLRPLAKRVFEYLLSLRRFLKHLRRQ